jgi:hypothetical protein
MSWAERARLNKPKQSKKNERLVGVKNKMQFNFGVLVDFFNYSAVSIQSMI